MKRWHLRKERWYERKIVYVWTITWWEYWHCPGERHTVQHMAHRPEIDLCVQPMITICILNMVTAWLLNLENWWSTCILDGKQENTTRCRKFQGLNPHLAWTGDCCRVRTFNQWCIYISCFKTILVIPSNTGWHIIYYINNPLDAWLSDCPHSLFIFL